MRIKIIFGLIFLLGLAFRLNGGLDHLLFTYDQARDAFYVQDILHGSLKLVGPPTDLPGVFHGPAYYYFLAPMYALGQGDPRFALLEMIILNLLAGVPIYLLANEVYKSKRVALISLLLFMVSFEAVSYARWLSNPALAVFPLAVFYLGLWRIIQKRSSGYLLAALGLGFSIQAQLFLLYLIPVFFIGVIIYQRQAIISKYLIGFVLVLSIILSTFVLAEIKFNFQGIKGFSGFVLDQNSSGEGLNRRLENYSFRMEQLFTRNLIPTFPMATPALIAVILGVNGYLFYKRADERKPLTYPLFILVSSLLVFFISKVDLTFITVGVGMGVIFLSGKAIAEIEKHSSLFAYGLLGTFIISNFLAATRFNSQGNIMFQVQEGMILADELKVINETYKIANRKSISLHAITNPLLFPTTWAYLYRWQADKNQLQIPFYHGITAYAFKGDRVFPRSDEIRSTDLTIVEPGPGVPEELKKKYLLLEKNRAPETEQKMIGKFLLLVRRTNSIY